MRAAVFDAGGALSSSRIADLPEPRPGDADVLTRAGRACTNRRHF